MAAAGQRDFQMLFSRRFSCNASTTSSPIDIICFCNGGLKFKGCSSQNARNILWNDCRVKAEKAYVYDEFVRVKDQPKIVYSRGFHRGNKQPFPKKIMVAVDVDEVLGNFVSALNQFIADRYSLNHSTSEYHVYEFFKIWNCSRDEANNRVHEFFKTPYFEKGILPIPGAQKALKRLTEVCNLSIVTSRQNAIKDHTIEWIEKIIQGSFRKFILAITLL